MNYFFSILLMHYVVVESNWMQKQSGQGNQSVSMMRRLIWVLRMWNRPLALSLAAIHAGVLLLAFTSKQPMPDSRPCKPEDSTPESFCFDPWTAAGVSVLADRPFHFSYEALPVKALMIGDLPTLVAIDIGIGPFLASVKRVSRVTESYVAGACWVVFGSLQWWLFGVYLSARRSKQRSASSRL